MNLFPRWDSNPITYSSANEYGTIDAMGSVKKSKKVAFVIGAAIGVIFTRLPYMEDGNLLVTNACVLLFGTVALLVWLAIEVIFIG